MPRSARNRLKKLLIENQFYIMVFLFLFSFLQLIAFIVGVYSARPYGYTAFADKQNICNCNWWPRFKYTLPLTIPGCVFGEWLKEDSRDAVR